MAAPLMDRGQGTKVLVLTACIWPCLVGWRPLRRRHAGRLRPVACRL